MDALLSALGFNTALAFLSPWLLAALVFLPLIWWVLRATPPAPSRQKFPAINILRGLKPREVTADHTPWWLLLLRLLALACLIVGLAGPLLSPEENTGSGPVLLVVDDDWAAAPGWSHRQRRIRSLVGRAARDNRPVYFITTTGAAVTGPLPANDALKQMQTLEPKAWNASDQQVSDALKQAGLPAGPDIIWLSSGVATTQEKTLLAETLQSLAAGNGRLTVYSDVPENLALRLLPPKRVDRKLEITVERPLDENTIAANQTATVQLIATDIEGKVVTVKDMTFEAGARKAVLLLDLPRDVRNRIYRLELETQNAAGNSAGAVQLLDDRWQQRSIGIITSFLSDETETNRLLSETYYLNTALRAFADVRTGTVAALLEQPRAVLFWPDANQISTADLARLNDWISAGGTLVRFAGPNLAREMQETGGVDDFLPVRLRPGDRTIGGALNWERPATLQPFDISSLFAGLAVPEDIEIRRQLLAEPDPDLAEKGQALLQDGTPLVTVKGQGGGQLVFFHVGATPRWSNLPLSLLFVDMLRRIVLEAAAAGSQKVQTTLNPLTLLDGFGRSRSRTGSDLAATPAIISAQLSSAKNPPGLYGTSGEKRALNLARPQDAFRSLEQIKQGLNIQTYSRFGEKPLKYLFLTAAFALLLLDILARLLMNGAFARRSRPRNATGSATGPAARPVKKSAGGPAGLVAVLFMAFALIAAWQPAFVSAQAKPGPDLQAILKTRLAYLKSGEGRKDANALAGLTGLTKWIVGRTTIELGEPVGLKLGEDALTFYPVIYWAVGKNQQPLPPEQVAEINAYLSAGGLLMIDTQDAGTARRNRGNRALINALRGISIPPLQPIPKTHVLTKAFYLLDWFPGKWAEGDVWVAANATGDAEAGILNDGVSPVVVGGADWAAAWAVTGDGTPMFPVVPGVNRQREMAYRFGTNTVMYALAGNYKADQVHVNAILNRIGQKENR